MLKMGNRNSKDRDGTTSVPICVANQIISKQQKSIDP